MLTPTQSAQNEWVSRQVVRACAARFGFDFPAPEKPVSDPDRLAAYSVLFRRYGISDAQSVRQWGYHVPRGVTAPEGEAPVLLSSFPTAMQAILTGIDPTDKRPVTSYQDQPVPKEGCLSEPDREVMGDDRPTPGGNNGPSGLVAKIKAESFAGSKADPRVASVFKAWSQCMKGAGYPLSDPMLAAAELPSMNGPTPTDQEIAQAEADVACKSSTKLAGVWFTVESEYQRAAIAEHTKDLAAVTTALKDQTAGINRLMSKFGAPAASSSASDHS